MFGDFRFVWTRSEENFCHFAIIGLHSKDKLFDITSMNPYGNMPTPALLYLAGKENHFYNLMDIIHRHVILDNAISVNNENK